MRLFFSAGLVLFLLALPGYRSAGFAAQQQALAVARLEIAGKRFQVEVADTSAAREQGLMKRRHLAAGKGMLFVFPEAGLHPFWMKNTLIPLDLIWIDEHWQVVGVERMEPCSEEQCRADSCPLYYPPAPIRYALEVNAGDAEGCRGKVVLED